MAVAVLVISMSSVARMRKRRIPSPSSGTVYGILRLRSWGCVSDVRSSCRGGRGEGRIPVKPPDRDDYIVHPTHYHQPSPPPSPSAGNSSGHRREPYPQHGNHAAPTPSPAGPYSRGAPSFRSCRVTLPPVTSYHPPSPISHPHPPIPPSGRHHSE